MAAQPPSSASLSIPDASSRPLGRNESTYSRHVEADGSVRFDVVPARGPRVLWEMLLIAPALGAWFGNGFNVLPGGLLLGLIFGVIFVIGRAAALSGLRSRQGRAGSFTVSPEGVRLHDGSFLARSTIRRLVMRNGMSGHVVTMWGGAGMAGQMAAIGAARQAREAALFETMAYQLAVETQGRAMPIVGAMTSATAEALFEDVSDILGLARR